MPRSVLIFYDYFSPAYKAGGPIRSLDNLVRLIHRDLEVYIFTTCKDHDGSSLQVETDSWSDFEGLAKVYYASEARQTYSNVKKQVQEIKPDVIHINGVFSLLCGVYPLRIAKKLHIPVIISPRGMLQKTSLSLKPFKKKVYLEFFKRMLLPGNRVTWHVTTSQEFDDLKTLFPRAATQLTGNVPHLVKEDQKSKNKSVTKLLTVALVSPMKNHHLIVEGLKNVQGEIIYDIYGPVKDAEYWGKCTRSMAGLPASIKVNYKGEVKPTDVDGLWKDYDFYIQPSKSENFGHAIFEALSAGLPVIISDQTPWRNLEVQKAGWDVSLEDPEALTNAIRRAMNMTNEEYQEWRKGARKLAESYVEEAGLKEKYLELFSC